MSMPGLARARLDPGRHAGPQLRYRASPDHPWTHVVFPETADPFEICNAARARVFPGVAMIPAAMTPASAPAPNRKRRRAA